MTKFLDLFKQYQMIKEEIDEAISNVINDSAFIGGKYVRLFEEQFAEFIGVKHCVGVGNGTDALEIILETLQLPKGSDIIIPANSFIATAEAVTRSGHNIIFAGVDPETYTINGEEIEKAVTSKSAAVIAVHLYGHPCDMDSILKAADQYHLEVIEDCAQAHGAEYKGRIVGTFGSMSAFSFYPGKNLGAYGDAGAIVSNDEKLARKARMIANHGRIEKYNHVFEGRNSRLDGLQAAVLSVKLKHLPNWIKTRINLADYYCENLSDIKDIILPKKKSWAYPVYHLFVIQAKGRDDLRTYLQENKIDTGIHYPIALPKLKAFEYLRKSDENLFCNQVDANLLSLPIGEHLQKEDLSKVVKAIHNFYDN